MILGRDEHVESACFDEIDTAVRALTDRVVCFNAHRYPAPEGSVVFNLENVPGQVSDPGERWSGHEVWDFSASNAAKYGATHVPIGYHPSMSRFEPALVKDIDIVFTGCVNDRRAKVLDDLAGRGLDVMIVPHGIYGAERDAVLARAKLVLNMLFYEDGVFPALRVAHLVANRVPVLSETCPESWEFIRRCPYVDLADTAEFLVKTRTQATAAAWSHFAAQPLVLPS